MNIYDLRNKYTIFPENFYYIYCGQNDIFTLLNMSNVVYNNDNNDYGEKFKLQNQSSISFNINFNNLDLSQINKNNTMCLLIDIKIKDSNPILNDNEYINHVYTFKLNGQQFKIPFFTKYNSNNELSLTVPFFFPINEINNETIFNLTIESDIPSENFNEIYLQALGVLYLNYILDRQNNVITDSLLVETEMQGYVNDDNINSIILKFDFNNFNNFNTNNVIIVVLSEYFAIPFFTNVEIPSYLLETMWIYEKNNVIFFVNDYINGFTYNNSCDYYSYTISYLKSYLNDKNIIFNHCHYLYSKIIYDLSDINLLHFTDNNLIINSENIMLQPTSLNGINGIDINDILSKIYTITINNPNIEKGKIYFYLDSKDENNMPFIPYNFLDSTNNIAWWKREENIKGNIIIFDFEKQLNNNNIIFTLNSIQEGGEGGIIPM